ncbi:MAG TPA: dephospho-CoA kinase [Candidatus Gallibacteroides avistercoris]|uniref:Dephospho-CoA kinase n=1 Tax=Candidatus Gallibacteroides avistercoris TaxID=2840833 RepID=A0A9D1M8J5_9BACT|nr:dephospho-CoA kinase [Candidatus Gallibacteroides avistercoris]
MIKIAITGGIGSGKSVVSRLLKVFSYPVYDADSRAKELMNRSELIRNRLISLLGDAAYKGDKLDRSYVASVVFSDRSLLQKVNAVVHPQVKDDFKTWSSRQSSRVVFLESAILFESGFETVVDCVWLVWAPERLRIERAVKRDGTTAEMVEQRIKAQWPEEKKIERADAVIRNDDSRSLIEQVQQLLSALSDDTK